LFSKGGRLKKERAYKTGEKGKTTVQRQPAEERGKILGRGKSVEISPLEHLDVGEG